MHQVHLRRGDGTDLMFSMMGHSTWFDFFSSGDKSTINQNMQVKLSVGYDRMHGFSWDLRGPSGPSKRDPSERCFFFLWNSSLKSTRCLTFSKVYSIMRKNTSTSENKAAKIYRTNAKNYPNPSTFADSNQRPTPLLHLSPDVSVDLENCHWPTWARGSCQWSPPQPITGNSRDPQ